MPFESLEIYFVHLMTYIPLFPLVIFYKWPEFLVINKLRGKWHYNGNKAVAWWYLPISYHGICQLVTMVPANYLPGYLPITFYVTCQLVTMVPAN